MHKEKKCGASKNNFLAELLFQRICRQMLQLRLKKFPWRHSSSALDIEFRPSTDSQRVERLGRDASCVGTLDTEARKRVFSCCWFAEWKEACRAADLERWRKKGHRFVWLGHKTQEARPGGRASPQHQALLSQNSQELIRTILEVREDIVKITIAEMPVDHFSEYLAKVGGQS